MHLLAELSSFHQTTAVPRESLRLTSKFLLSCAKGCSFVNTLWWLSLAGMLITWLSCHATTLKSCIDSSVSETLDDIPTSCQFHPTALGIRIPGPLLSQPQTLFQHFRISRNELHLEVSGYSHQCRFKLIIVDVVCIRWLGLAGNDLEAAQKTHESCIQKSVRYQNQLTGRPKI